MGALLVELVAAPLSLCSTAPPLPSCVAPTVAAAVAATGEIEIPLFGEL